jgi:hypothetical protein
VDNYRPYKKPWTSSIQLFTLVVSAPFLLVVFLLEAAGNKPMPYGAPLALVGVALG